MVTYLVCSEGVNEKLRCTRPFNVTVNAWMVRGNPIAYSRNGIKPMNMGTRADGGKLVTVATTPIKND